MIDIRLQNTSQLAGFAKRDDLQYFLRELCGAEYCHLPELCPTPEILEGYKKKTLSWPQYEEQFRALLRGRRVEQTVDKRLFAEPAVLLCSEPTAEHCHRRLAAEYLARAWQGAKVVHL